MPSLIIKAVVPAVKVLLPQIAKKAAKIIGPLILSAGTGYIVEFAKGKAKKKSGKDYPNDVYETEYQKHLAKYNAERDAKTKPINN